MAVTAPISDVLVKVWPRLARSASQVARKAGSAETDAVLRWLARGAATASGRVAPKSRRLSSVCRTVVMIMDPPGEPSARTGSPPSRTIVGLIDERGRLPGAGRLGSGAVPCVGVKLKSVNSLFSRNPRLGTTTPDPPV